MKRPLKTIPIYDATAPIACTATNEEITGRIEQLERMRTHLTRFERTEHGLSLHFPNRPDIDAHVRRFTADEQRCCTFWGFDVAATGDELTLRWDGPPDVASVFDRLGTWLDSTVALSPETGWL